MVIYLIMFDDTLGVTVVCRQSQSAPQENDKNDENETCPTDVESPEVVIN